MKQVRTLLLVHGIGCTASVWDRMVPLFEAAGWSCHALTLFADQRRHDGPSPGLSQLRLSDYVRQVDEEASRLATVTGRKPAIIGHSMGGLIAQILAARGSVSQAVFLTPAQPADCARITLPVVWTFLNIILAFDRSRPRRIWKPGFRYGILNRVPKDLHDTIWTQAVADSMQVYADISKGVEVDHSVVSIPTLTIGAGQDRATPVQAVRRVARKYAASPCPGEYREYPGHGHWIIDEPGTGRVAADIISWLEKGPG